MDVIKYMTGFLLAGWLSIAVSGALAQQGEADAAAKAQRDVRFAACVADVALMPYLSDAWYALDGETRVAVKDVCRKAVQRGF